MEAIPGNSRGIFQTGGTRLSNMSQLLTFPEKPETVDVSVSIERNCMCQNTSYSTSTKEEFIFLLGGKV